MGLGPSIVMTMSSETDKSYDLNSKKSIFLAPLGGLGEIGMNMMAVVYRKKAIIIDCGLMFPNADEPGVDIIIPRIDFLKDHGIEVIGIILTHGHEDHIGAIPFVIDELGFPPVYGTPFTLALIEERLREAGHLKHTTFEVVHPPQSFSVGDFKIQSIQVTHSVVDSMGLMIETPIGRIIHSGDFKMDQHPIDGKNIDEKRLKDPSIQNLLLMSDSTNVEREGWSRSEEVVGKTFKQLFAEIETGKIIVGVFASNIHRIQQIYDEAVASKRKVSFLGRSMRTNVEIACRLKHLKIDRSNVVDPSDIDSLDAKKIVMIATGTQAEPRSVLYRLSLNDHPETQIHPGDTVILSSRFIPGNERNISHLINNLYRRGAEVIDSDMADVHCSGHAYQDEQIELLKWTKPKFFLPVHGEYRMLVKHLRLAQSVDSHIRGLIAENGDLIELSPERIKKVSQFPAGKVFLDEAAGDIHEELIRDRVKMASTGLVVASLVLHAKKGALIEGPNFDVRGLPTDDLALLEGEVLTMLEDLSKEARTDEVEVKEELRRVTRRFFRKATGTKPVVVPLIYFV